MKAGNKIKLRKTDTVATFSLQTTSKVLSISTSISRYIELLQAPFHVAFQEFFDTRTEDNVSSRPRRYVKLPTMEQ